MRECSGGSAESRRVLQVACAPSTSGRSSDEPGRSHVAPSRTTVSRRTQRRRCSVLGRSYTLGVNDNCVTLVYRIPARALVCTTCSTFIRSCVGSTCSSDCFVSFRVCAHGMFSSALLLSSLSRCPSPVSAERSSTAGRIARPADPTSPGGVIPPVHHSAASYRTTGQPKAEGSRTPQHTQYKCTLAYLRPVGDSGLYLYWQ
eukprot:4993249-Prymnesium_polylepis.1